MPWTKTDEQQAAALAEATDPMTAVLERRKKMLASIMEPPGGLVRRPVRRGDYRARKR